MTTLTEWLSKNLDEQFIKVEKLERTASGTLNAHAFYNAESADGLVVRLVARRALENPFPGRNSNSMQHAIQSRLYENGLMVPRSIGVFDDQQFMLFAEGTGSPDQVITDGTSPALIQTLANQVAKLHGAPTDGLRLTDWREKSDALADAAGPCREVDAFAELIEKALGYLRGTTLVHNDFRTGNFLVHNENLVSLLDFDLTCLGDPVMDLAWFCAPRWRYQRQDLPAGGLTSIEVFLTAYEAASGTGVNRESFDFWLEFAIARTNVMRIVQAERGFIWSS